jgi:hypothetical protein
MHEARPDLPPPPPAPQQQLLLPEADAARAVWLQRFESPAPLPPWTAEDADWATREAARQLGADAAPARFVACRARLGVQRLAQRGQPLPAGVTGPRHAALIALAAGLLLGALMDAAGAGGRINILAPPLMGLLLWNLAVYTLLLVQALRPRRQHAPQPPGLRAWLQRWTLPAALRRASSGRAGTPLLGFAEAWSRATQPLQQARIVAALHLGAVGFALGALASLYAHGLVFEYRAGWESTFLSARAVERLLGLLLGPASAASGIALPAGDAAWAQLRFPQGGENAARWIHLWALTVGALVIVPRLLLAGFTGARARRLSQRVPVGDDSRWRRLLRQQGGPALPLQVLPYSYRLAPERAQALQCWLEDRLGPLALQWAAPLGDSDDDRMGAPPLSAGAQRVLLFTLTATPEAETHGALLRALREPPAEVVIDEADFRRRFTGPAGEQRLQQRRAAWSHLLADAGLAPPHFVDLSALPAAAEAPR